MKLILKGHDARYAVEQSLLAFFPQERPVYDPAADHTLHAADMVSRCDYTPFEGFRTSGSIAAVYLRGMPAVENGVVRDVTGEYLKRGKCAL